MFYRTEMKKYGYILLSLILLLQTLSACSEFDTHSLGQKFNPYNSFVTKFRQLVYVEYKDGVAEVWGPCANRVEVNIESESHVSIKSDLDSLVVVAYGFAAHDTIRDVKDKTIVLGVVDYHGDLSIESNKPYALYLTGLQLNSETGTALYCKGSGDCFLVLTDKANNILNGACEFDGPLLFDGKGSLTINTTDRDALVARKGLTCGYPISANLRSREGNALSVKGGELKIADGKWNIQSGAKAILSADQTVVINGGTCYGIGSKPLDVKFDGNQFTWHAPADTLSFQADSIYQVGRMGLNDTIAKPMVKLKSLFDQPTPFVMMSNGIVADGDIITFSK